MERWKSLKIVCIKCRVYFYFFHPSNRIEDHRSECFLSRYEIHALLIRLLVYNSYPVRKTFIHQISKKFNPWIIYTIFLPLSNVLYIYISLSIFSTKTRKKIITFHNHVNNVNNDFTTINIVLYLTFRKMECRAVLTLIYTKVHQRNKWHKFIIESIPDKWIPIDPILI